MNTLKKRIITFMAAIVVSLSAIGGTICVSAQSTTPVTGNGVVTITQPEQSQTQETTSEAQTETEAEVPVPTAVAVTQQEASVVETTQAQRATDKKYSSKGFVILWFFLSVLVNVVLSFMIANRFYKMSKRENHINAEIRALRRDLEEKFINSVDGFAEMETDITNTNENLSADGSIDLGEAQKQSYSKESDDVFRQWENKMARRSAKAVVSEENDEFIEEEEKEVGAFSSRTKKYSPTREGLMSSKKDESEEETKVDAIKNKAKGIINNIFPFKD